MSFSYKLQLKYLSQKCYRSLIFINPLKLRFLGSEIFHGYLFWIMHPTTQLGALSKRHMYYHHFFKGFDEEEEEEEEEEDCISAPNSLCFDSPLSSEIHPTPVRSSAVASDQLHHHIHTHDHLQHNVTYKLRDWTFLKIWDQGVRVSWLGHLVVSKVELFVAVFGCVSMSSLV